MWMWFSPPDQKTYPICCFLLSYRIKQFPNVLQHFKRWTSVNDILFRALTKCQSLLIWLDFDCMCCFWLPSSEEFMNENVYIILYSHVISLFFILAFMCVSNNSHLQTQHFFYHVSLISFALLPCSPFSILLVAFPMQNIKLKLIRLVSIEKDTAKRLLRKRRKFFPRLG